MKCGCTFVRCVTSGEGFEKGVIYPVLGTNNGIHIFREENTGHGATEPFDFVAQTGGIGEGTFNNWDSSGRPSFDACSVWTVKWDD